MDLLLWSAAAVLEGGSSLPPLWKESLVIIELISIGIGTVLTALIMRRQDKSREHEPRAIKLLQPPTTYQKPVKIRSDIAYRRDLAQPSPQPVGGFGVCYICAESWTQCAAHRGRGQGACCTECNHKHRVEPTHKPGGGVPSPR